MRLRLLLLAAGVTLAQPAAEFDVVSIKPHPEPITISSNMTRGGSYRGVAITLLDLIEDAYHVEPNQVTGGPNWLTSAHFDVDANAPGEEALTMERARSMLQAMLADRFKLKLRRESQEVAAYDLVLAKGEPKFKESSDPKARPGLVTRASPTSVHLEADRVTMARLAEQLAFGAGRPVVDKTGLPGEYALALDYAQDNSPAAVDGSAATLFTALQEQLGLKMEPSRTMRDVLVIESAEKPSAN
jgi:uncharacterized protein (TIGR03435 family)